MWHSESVGRLSRDARLLLVGLITQVDDDGRTRASSRGLASLLLPFDEINENQIDAWIEELEKENIFHRYVVDGATYGYLPNFNKHQKIDHPSKSKYPPPTDILANPREGSRILANPREPSRILAPDQGSGSGSGSSLERNGDVVRPEPGGLIQIDPDAPDEDPAKVFTPAPPSQPAPISDDDRWKYEIQQSDWAQDLKRKGAKIFAKNWVSWQGLIQRIPLEKILEALASLPATDRWPDRVEVAATPQKPGEIAEDVGKKLRSAVMKITSGHVECFLKNGDLAKMAENFGVIALIDLAQHAVKIRHNIDKDLARLWYSGRPSQFGGYDGYSPKKKLEKPRSPEEISAEIDLIAAGPTPQEPVAVVDAPAEA